MEIEGGRQHSFFGSETLVPSRDSKVTPHILDSQPYISPTYFQAPLYPGWFKYSTVISFLKQKHVRNTEQNPRSLSGSLESPPSIFFPVSSGKHPLFLDWGDMEKTWNYSLCLLSVYLFNNCLGTLDFFFIFLCNHISVGFSHIYLTSYKCLNFLFVSYKRKPRSTIESWK